MATTYSNLVKCEPGYQTGSDKFVEKYKLSKRAPTNLKILLPLFVQQHSKCIEYAWEDMDWQFHCPDCFELHSSCLCEEIESLTLDPTANYRVLLKRNNFVYRHKVHKRSMKQLLNKFTVQPESGRLMEFFTGIKAASIETLIESSGKTVDKLNEFLPDAHVTMENFTESLSKIQNSIAQTGSKIGATCSTLDNIKDMCVIVSCFGTGLYWSYDMYDAKRISIFVINLVIAKFLLSDNIRTKINDLLLSLLEKVSHYFFHKDTGDIVPEIGLDDISDFSGMLASGLGIYSMSNIDKNHASAFKNILVDSTRVKRGLEDCLKSVMKCLEFVSNFIREKFFSLPGMRLFSSSNTEVDQFLDDLTDLHFLENRGDFRRTPSNFDKVGALILRAKKIVKEVPRDKNSEGFLKLVNDEMRYLKDLYTVFKNLNFTKQGIRQEPVGILLQGAAGVGKSITVMHLVNALCGSLLDDEEYKEFQSSAATKVSVHCPETKFWDGYRSSSLVTIIDDFGQATDVAGNPDNEFVKTIRAVNSFEYIMHMASLEQKGTTYFDSKFYVCTTNVKAFQANSIVSVEALDRRFPARYIVSIEDQYCTEDTKGEDYYVRKLDVSKLPVACLDNEDYLSLNPEVQIFIPSNNLGQPCGPPIKFDEFVDIVINMHNMREQWQSTQNVEFKTTRDKYRKKREALQAKFVQNELNKFLDSSDSEDDSSTCDLNMQVVPESNISFENFYDTPSVNEFLEQLYSLYNEQENDIADKLIYKYESRVVELFKFCLERFPDITIYSEKHLLLLCISLFGKNFYSNFGLRRNDVLKKFIRHNYEELMDSVRTPSSRCGIIQTMRSKYTIFKSYILDELLPFYDKSGFIETFKMLLFCQPVLFLIITVLVTSIGAGALWSLNKLFFTMFGINPTSESLSSDKAFKPKGANKTYIMNTAAAKALVVAEAMTDIDRSGYDLSRSVLKKSWFKIMLETAPNSDNYSLMGACFNITDRIVIMPYHFIRTMIAGVEENATRKTCKVKLFKDFRGDKTGVVIVSVADCIKGHEVGTLANNDLVLVRMPRIFPIGVNRLSNFGSRSDCSRYTRGIPMTMKTPNTEEDCIFAAFADAVDNTAVTSKELGLNYFIRKGYAYKGFTNGGDCGAMLVFLDNKNPARKFFGMHVAGLADKNNATGLSYSAAICVEDLEEDLKLFSDIVELEDVVVSESSTIFGEGKFETIGKPDRSPNAVLNTAIVKSPLYGMFGDVKVGYSMLKPTEIDGVIIDPFEVALSKYCNNPTIPIDIKILNLAVEDYKEFISNLDPLHTRKIFTVQDVLDGSEFINELSSLTSSTSPGYPMNINGIENLKKKYYSAPDSDAKRIALKQIEFAVDEYIGKLSEGIVPVTIYTDNLKDERRAFEKILKGSTRLFSGCPFIYLIVNKMYFGSFSLWYQNNKVENESAIGVNPYSQDWDSIARKLHSFGNDDEIVNKGAGDYAGYDGSQVPTIQYELLDIINDWYADEFGKLRSLLFESVVHSQHIYRGIIYKWNGSLPSGYALTAMLNSMYNSVAFRFTWYLQDVHRPMFHKHVKLIVLGDDNAFATDPNFSEYNELNLPPLMASIGLTYTPEDKTSLLIHPARKLADIEFLKRKWRYDETYRQYVAPLRFSVLEEMIQFSKKGATRDKICVDNCIIAIQEASLHDEFTYYDFSAKVVNEVLKYYPDLTPSAPWKMSYERRKASVLDTNYFFL